MASLLAKLMQTHATRKLKSSTVDPDRNHSSKLSIIHHSSYSFVLCFIFRVYFIPPAYEALVEEDFIDKGREQDDEAKACSSAGR